MPTKHALLSASSSARWLHCPPSARLEERVEEKPSAYAAEGTLAHSKAEEKLTNYLEGHPRKKVECPNGEMQEATTDYRNYVIEVLNAEKKKCPDAKLFVEVELDLSEWIPEGFGTSDVVVVSDDCLHVIDFKYGAGVAVSAQENSQLLLYAAGAMQIYDALYGFENITIHIYQPRIDHFDTFETTRDQLINWLETVVRPKASLAFEGKGNQAPGEWCRFCKVKASCKARAQQIKDLQGREQMLDGMLLNDEEISAILPKLKEITSWAKDLQDYALERALEGTKYKGYKVVEGTSRRRIVDDLEAMQKLQSAGFTYTDIIDTKLKNITALQQLTGKNQLAEILGDTLMKPPGAPTLVPETDKRPEWKAQVAIEAFGDEIDEANKS